MPKVNNEKALDSSKSSSDKSALNYAFWKLRADEDKESGFKCFFYAKKTDDIFEKKFGFQEAAKYFRMAGDKYEYQLGRDYINSLMLERKCYVTLGMISANDDNDEGLKDTLTYAKKIIDINDALKEISESPLDEINQHDFFESHETSFFKNKLLFESTGKIKDGQEAVMDAKNLIDCYEHIKANEPEVEQYKRLYGESIETATKFIAEFKKQHELIIQQNDIDRLTRQSSTKRKNKIPENEQHGEETAPQKKLKTKDFSEDENNEPDDMDIVDTNDVNESESESDDHAYDETDNRPNEIIKIRQVYGQKPGFTKIGDRKPEIDDTQKKPRLYLATRKRECERFTKAANHKLTQEGKQPFDYIREQAIDTNTQVNLGWVNAIGGYGAYAAKKITAAQRLGVYVGDRRKPLNRDQHVDGAAYIFELVNNKGEVYEEIDGEVTRNWTAFINHSQTPNIKVVPEIIGKEGCIVFYALRDIEPGEQLVYDYGDAYFFNLYKDYIFRPYYLHPDHNWQSPADVYQAHRELYCEGTYAFDKKTCDDLQLPPHEYLIPEIFRIVDEDPKAVAKFIKAKTKNLPIYAVDGMKNYHGQPLLTILQYLCYLGREVLINLLLDAGEDPNRCMFKTGFTALSLLMMGNASCEVVERISAKLLANKSLTPYPFINDINDRNILHYAIMRQSPELLMQVLETAKARNVEKEDDKVNDLFKHMILISDEKSPDDQPKFADFDHCLKTNQFKLLEILLIYINKETVEDGLMLTLNEDGIEDRKIFRKQTLNDATTEQLDQLLTVLNQASISKKLKNTDIIRVINEKIKEKNEKVEKQNDDTADKLQKNSNNMRKESKGILEQNTEHTTLFKQRMSRKKAVRLDYNQLHHVGKIQQKS